MNIAIDTTSFGHDEVKNKNLVNSTSIFTADLLDGFVKLGLAENFTLIVSENHEEFFSERFPQFKRLVLKWLPLSLAYKFSKGRIKGSKYIKKLGIYKKIVEKQNFDLIWFPYTVSYSFVPTKTKSICTIHDMFRYHELSETKYFNTIGSEKNQIVTISNYTKNDIVQTLNYKKDIPVIPNSVQFEITENEEIQELADKKFILDINAYIAKKNPITLLKAFNLIKDKTDFDLAFCGGYKDENLFAEMISFIEQNEMKNRVKLFIRIPTAKRNWLLLNAKLFVTPSLFEGFGRTPVEAAMCKIPVISTKETSLYDATMGLVNYVENAKDEKELADLILNKMNNPDSKEKLSQIADKLKSEYTPENCASKYWEIFMEQTADSRQQTADSRQQTADSRQQTADSRQQTADSNSMKS